jgi:hypothetical protein
MKEEENEYIRKIHKKKTKSYDVKESSFQLQLQFPSI